MIARLKAGLGAAASTAVVTIALVGALFAGSSSALATPSGVHVRVEGSAQTIFSGYASAQPTVMTDADGVPHSMDGNAMWALGNASVLGLFPYVLSNQSWGLFIDSVAGEQSVPTPPYPGWMYRVNGVSPLDGADQHVVTGGDKVLWYYGAWDASPTVAVVPVAPVAEGATFTVTAQQLDFAGMASPLPGATIYVGSTSMIADELGQAEFVAGPVGDYGVRVEAPGCIRSAVETLMVRVLTDADVWRFYNIKKGTHFYTADPAEKAGIISKLSATYRLDGLAYTVNEAAAANGKPLHRFFNKKTGTHFYTVSESEKSKVLSTMGSTFSYEGVAYYVSDTAPTGATPVWRFFNKKNGTHFYTADPAEKTKVETTMASRYQLDGVGFYLAP